MSAIPCRVCALSEVDFPNTITIGSASLTGGTPTEAEQSITCQNTSISKTDCDGTPTGADNYQGSYDVVHTNSVLSHIESALTDITLSKKLETGSSGSDSSQWSSTCTAQYNLPASVTAPEYTDSTTPTGTIQHAHAVGVIGSGSELPTFVVGGACCIPPTVIEYRDSNIYSCIEGYVTSPLGPSSEEWLTLSATATPCQNTWLLSITGGLRVYQRIRHKEVISQVDCTFDDQYSHTVRPIQVNFSGSKVVHDLSNINVSSEFGNIDVSISASGDVIWSAVDGCTALQGYGVAAPCVLLPNGCNTIATTSSADNTHMNHDRWVAKWDGGTLNVNL